MRRQPENIESVLQDMSPVLQRRLRDTAEQLSDAGPFGLSYVQAVAVLRQFNTTRNVSELADATLTIQAMMALREWVNVTRVRERAKMTRLSSGASMTAVAQITQLMALYDGVALATDAGKGAPNTVPKLLRAVGEKCADFRQSLQDSDSVGRVDLPPMTPAFQRALLLEETNQPTFIRTTPPVSEAASSHHEQSALLGNYYTRIVLEQIDFKSADDFSDFAQYIDQRLALYVQLSRLYVEDGSALDADQKGKLLTLIENDISQFAQLSNPIRNNLLLLFSERAQALSVQAEALRQKAEMILSFDEADLDVESQAQLRVLLEEAGDIQDQYVFQAEMLNAFAQQCARYSDDLETDDVFKATERQHNEAYAAKHDLAEQMEPLQRLYQNALSQNAQQLVVADAAQFASDLSDGTDWHEDFSQVFSGLASELGALVDSDYESGSANEYRALLDQLSREALLLFRGDASIVDLNWQDSDTLGEFAPAFLAMSPLLYEQMVAYRNLLSKLKAQLVQLPKGAINPADDEIDTDETLTRAERHESALAHIHDMEQCVKRLLSNEQFVALVRHAQHSVPKAVAEVRLLQNLEALDGLIADSTRVNRDSTLITAELFDEFEQYALEGRLSEISRLARQGRSQETRVEIINLIDEIHQQLQDFRVRPDIEMDEAVVDAHYEHLQYALNAFVEDDVAPLRALLEQARDLTQRSDRSKVDFDESGFVYVLTETDARQVAGAIKYVRTQIQLMRVILNIDDVPVDLPQELASQFYVVPNLHEKYELAFEKLHQACQSLEDALASSERAVQAQASSDDASAPVDEAASDDDMDDLFAISDDDEAFFDASAPQREAALLKAERSLTQFEPHVSEMLDEEILVLDIPAQPMATETNDYQAVEPFDRILLRMAVLVSPVSESDSEKPASLRVELDVTGELSSREMQAILSMLTADDPVLTSEQQSKVSRLQQVLRLRVLTMPPELLEQYLNFLARRIQAGRAKANALFEQVNTTEADNFRAFTQDQLSPSSSDERQYFNVRQSMQYLQNMCLILGEALDAQQEAEQNERFEPALDRVDALVDQCEAQLKDLNVIGEAFEYYLSTSQLPRLMHRSEAESDPAAEASLEPNVKPDVTEWSEALADARHHRQALKAHADDHSNLVSHFRTVHRNLSAVQIPSLDGLTRENNLIGLALYGLSKNSSELAFSVFDEHRSLSDSEPDLAIDLAHRTPEALKNKLQERRRQVVQLLKFVNASKLSDRKFQRNFGVNKKGLQLMLQAQLGSVDAILENQELWQAYDRSRQAKVRVIAPLLDRVRTLAEDIRIKQRALLVDVPGYENIDPKGALIELRENGVSAVKSDARRKLLTALNSRADLLAKQIENLKEALDALREYQGVLPELLSSDSLESLQNILDYYQYHVLLGESIPETNKAPKVYQGYRQVLPEYFEQLEALERGETPEITRAAVPSAEKAAAPKLEAQVEDSMFDLLAALDAKLGIEPDDAPLAALGTSGKGKEDEEGEEELLSTVDTDEPAAAEPGELTRQQMLLAQQSFALQYQSPADRWFDFAPPLHVLAEEIQSEHFMSRRSETASELAELIGSLEQAAEPAPVTTVVDTTRSEPRAQAQVQATRAQVASSPLPAITAVSNAASHIVRTMPEASVEREEMQETADSEQLATLCHQIDQLLIKAMLFGRLANIDSEVSDSAEAELEKLKVALRDIIDQLPPGADTMLQAMWDLRTDQFETEFATILSDYYQALEPENPARSAIYDERPVPFQQKIAEVLSRLSNLQQRHALFSELVDRLPESVAALYDNTVDRLEPQVARMRAAFAGMRDVGTGGPLDIEIAKLEKGDYARPTAEEAGNPTRQLMAERVNLTRVQAQFEAQNIIPLKAPEAIIEQNPELSRLQQLVEVAQRIGQQASTEAEVLQRFDAARWLNRYGQLDKHPLAFALARASAEVKARLRAPVLTSLSGSESRFSDELPIGLQFQMMNWFIEQPEKNIDNATLADLYAYFTAVDEDTQAPLLIERHRVNLSVANTQEALQSLSESGNAERDMFARLQERSGKVSMLVRAERAANKAFRDFLTLAIVNIPDRGLSEAKAESQKDMLMAKLAELEMADVALADTEAFCVELSEPDHPINDMFDTIAAQLEAKTALVHEAEQLRAGPDPEAADIVAPEPAVEEPELAAPEVPAAPAPAPVVPAPAAPAPAPAAPAPAAPVPAAPAPAAPVPAVPAPPRSTLFKLDQHRRHSDTLLSRAPKRHKTKEGMEYIERFGGANTDVQSTEFSLMNHAHDPSVSNAERQRYADQSLRVAVFRILEHAARPADQGGWNELPLRIEASPADQPLVDEVFEIFKLIRAVSEDLQELTNRDIAPQQWWAARPESKAFKGDNAALWKATTELAETLNLKGVRALKSVDGFAPSDSGPTPPPTMAA